MLYCELVTVTYRLSSGKRRLVYSISTLLLPSLSLSLSALASNENRILYLYISPIRLFFSIATLPVLKYFFIYFRREENMHVDRNKRGKKKKVRARKRIARVSRKLRIHGLSIGRNVLPMVDNVAVTAECPGQNESSERNTGDAYAGNVFPCAFCFSRSWLEYRIQAVA